MTTVIGKVRLVEPGTPGLPPRPPNMEDWCDERIEVQHVPGLLHEEHTIAYLCTRYPHSADEVHVSDPVDPVLGIDTLRTPDPRVIVWGGE